MTKIVTKAGTSATAWGDVPFDGTAMIKIAETREAAADLRAAEWLWSN